MDKTIEYYNQNADMFAQGTRLVDFTILQERFRKMLPVGSRILDFGCGSGRDTKYFLEKGYQVAATDGSAELCRLAGSFATWCSNSDSYRKLFGNYTAVSTLSS